MYSSDLRGRDNSAAPTLSFSHQIKRLDTHCERAAGCEYYRIALLLYMAAVDSVKDPSDIYGSKCIIK